MIAENQFQKLRKQYPVIDLLPEPLRSAIQRDGFCVNAAPGRNAFVNGDRCASFLFILSGQIRVVKFASQGREILLYDVCPGESCILTVSGILGNKPYPAAGIWDDNCAACAISDELFQQLIAGSPPFRTFIFGSFSERVTHLMELVDAVVWRPISSRLAQVLINKGAGGEIHISHQKLANELGTVREVVSRALEEFERKGFVQLARMRITIRDRDGLEQLAE